MYDMCYVSSISLELFLIHIFQWFMYLPRTFRQNYILARYHFDNKKGRFKDTKIIIYLVKLNL
jgi:hypothetical protein